MLRLVILCLIMVIVSPSCVRVSNAQMPVISAIPVLKVMNDTSNRALHISVLNVDVKVVGNIATTTFDITFYNSLDKILEGEFEFPLADGQDISHYALDVNGRLREGVVAEKAKARIAFENTVRRKIDPGLVEKTKGNNFKTRIYPIPAKGYKRVVIGIEQSLGYVNNNLVYRLPLYSPEAIDSFSITSTVLTIDVKPAMEDNSLANFTFAQWNKTWRATYASTGFVANNTVAFSIPQAGDGGNTVFTETHNGNTYFYMNTAMQGGYESKPKPASILLLWDISASAKARDVHKEIRLIEQYIAALGIVSVQLIPFNIKALPGELVAIREGYAGYFTNLLKRYYFDGGTQLGAIDLKRYRADEILLFSDGLSTFGREEMSLSNVPVTTVSSSPSANFSYLKYIAAETHGKFIDLSKMEVAKAVGDMVQEPLQFISTVHNTEDAEEVYTGTASANNGFSMAGILKKPSATITVNFGYGNKITQSKKYTIVKQEANDHDNVKRIWASLKIAQLDLRYEKNKEAITALGKEFSIVTQNTSLLVLDRVEDYVEHEIVPPAELQKEYYVLLKERVDSKRDEKAIAFEEASDAMEGLKFWWNNKYPLKIIEKVLSGRVRYSNEALADSVAVVMDTTATYIGTINQEGEKDEGIIYAAKPPPPPAPMQEEAKLMIQDVQLEDIAPLAHFNLNKSKAEEQGVEAAISIKRWEPDAAYLKILGATAAEKHVEKYLELKKEYADQPSFYVDVARFFFGKHQRELAVRVLSNVCELKLEDVELLRIVANQLLEFGETSLAIETFKQVLKIREEEPQSYRDLALAHNDAGEFNEAVALLYKVVTGTWSDRFGGVRTVALNEMNAIISAHPGVVNTSGIDVQFIVAMPLDVRIVLNWSSDNSDVDLWVTEPNKEKCNYENKLTRRGGSLSGDITQGYGPEEYTIKKASTGAYVIEANLYGDSRQTLGGPITVKAELFTNFGRASQKRKVINFRVTSDKEVVRIGKLEWLVVGG